MSLEAETRFLECIVTKPELIKDFQLEVEDFLKPQHQDLFSEIKAFDEKEGFVDVFIFLDYLNKKFEDQNLWLLVTSLIASAISSDHAEVYAKAIKRDSLSNELANTLARLELLVRDHGPYADKYEAVLNAITKHQEVKETDSLSITDGMKGFIEEMERRSAVEGIDGLATGFKLVDERLMGLKPTDLIIVAGRPSMGKTTFALNIADKVALDGKSVQLFSLEMGHQQLVDKTMAHISDVPLDRIKSGKPEEHEWPKISNAMARFKGMKFFINDRANTVQKIAIECKRTKLKHGLDLVVIDYLQLMSGKGENRTNEISDISRGLKLLAMELNVPIICLSQLNRSLETRADKRPMMSDLRESGSIEQDADIIMFIYRDEVYYPDHPQNKGVAEILTKKFRNGEVGTDYLGADLRKSKFLDMPVFNYEPYADSKSKNRGGFNG